MGEEGYVEVTGGRVWYSIQGEGDGVPLVAVHGGPGTTHNASVGLAELGERRVVFYDQLGCGRSDRVDDPGLWTIERFVEEIGQLRASLDLERVHLHGTSWGAMVAAAYMGTRPSGVASLTLASPLISVARWTDDARRLRSRLPEDVQRVLDHHEENAYTGCPEYIAAYLVFYKRHVCRLEVWPDPLERSFKEASREMYETMWGPSEFHPTGTLVGADVSEDLTRVSCPALFLCGEHDEATPSATRHFASLVPDSRIEVFEGCSHMPLLEAPERYLGVLRRFLADVA